MKKNILWFISLALFFPSLAQCLQPIEKLDKNKDGKIDTWTTRDENGNITLIASDRHIDGLPDYWIYLDPKDGSVFKREWDRNFDGRADFRTLEHQHRLIEKQYDDNFDGRFETIQKAPPRGSAGRAKTRIGP